MEVWKEIKDWGNYQVSNEGRVRNKNTKKILKPFQNEFGYLMVCLRNNGKQKTIRVSRLVAEAFIPNPENKPEVNHLNGKTDNRAESLEWSTRSENMLHAFKTGLKVISEKQKDSCRKLGKSLGKKVIQYDLQGNFIKEWDSTAEAGRQLKINQSNISACCRGKRNKVGGYVWRYKEVNYECL